MQEKLKQTKRYDVVNHFYIDDDKIGENESNAFHEGRGICARVGCQLIADYPYEYESSDGRTGFVCYPCDDYWYHVGSRHHKDGCGCDPNNYGQCPNAKMEFKPETK